MSIVWESRYALRMKGITSSTIRELLKLTQRPEVISFAGGLPAAEYFPIERFKEACSRVLAQSGRQALQYATTEGYPPLRELIAARLCASGVCVDADNVLVTSGSQQALSLIGALLINPGDRVLIEEPTYLGALQAFALYQASYIGVPLDDNGIRTELLPRALLHGPKFMYILPNFQNPAGVTLSQARRRELVDISHQTGVPIVEDDPYGELRFEGEPARPIVSIDAEALGLGSTAYSGNVIELGTFSKTLAPGLRVAWIIAPKEVIGRLVQIKQGTDLHSSIFTQMVVYEVAKDGFLDEHIAQLREVYRKRRDAMLTALDRHMPAGVEWTQPTGGLFLWLKFPEGTPITELFQTAVQRDVAFVPGQSFFTRPDCPPTARLNFSCMDEERIAEGIHRLAVAVSEMLPTAQPVPGA